MLKILPNKYHNFTNKLIFRHDKFKYLLSEKFGFKFKPYLPNFPLMVLVESTNRCNLCCAHCPRQFLEKEANFKEGDIDFSLFKRIVDELANYPGTTLRPFSDGEPLLYPYIVEIIKYAKNKGVSKIWLNTNGTLMNKTVSESLIDTGLDILEVSIDAYKEDTYRIIRRNNNFKKVVENVLNAIDTKKKLNSKIKIAVSIVHSDVNDKELDDFRMFWNDKADQVIVRPYHTDPENVMGDSKSVVSRRKRWPCPQLWQRLSVNFDGKVRFCVNDWRHSGIVGDVNKESLLDIWHGERLTAIRQALVSGHFKDVPLCHDCHEWEHWTW